MATHSLLARLIRRHLGAVDVTAEPWLSFLQAVDATYHEADSDRYLMERAMEISSEELLQANAAMRGLLQAFPDLVLSIDSEGKVVEQRGNASGTFGRSEDVLGWPLLGLVVPADVAALDKAIAATRSTRAVTSVVATCRSRGAAYEIRLAPEGGSNLVAIVRDVTEARRAEQLRLEKESADAASRAKSAFLANMSHELRTPLAVMIGYAELLQEEAAGQVSEDLQNIITAGLHLRRIVNSLLDLSRIEAGRVTADVEAIPIPALVADLTATAKPLAEANGNALRVDVTGAPDVVHTDRTKTTQIVTNLLGNACKFTSEGEVALTVRAVERRARPGVAFAVSDTGIGIPAAQIDALFRDFTQADPSIHERFGGSGLGLAISRRLSQLLGGTIDVESTEGAGSVFTVWLPDQATQRTAADPAATEELPR
jgi:signal transduction histidine kinase